MADAAEDAAVLRKMCFDKTKLLMERKSLKNHITGWFQTWLYPLHVWQELFEGHLGQRRTQTEAIRSGLQCDFTG